MKFITEDSAPILAVLGFFAFMTILGWSIGVFEKPKPTVISCDCSRYCEKGYPKCCDTCRCCEGCEK